VLEKEDVKRAHGLGEHGLYHICQLEAKPVIWKVLFEHCLCDIDSADFTQSFLLEIGEVIPTADKEEDMAVDEEPNQQKRTTQPSTPNRNPSTEEANESPLPTQKNKRQAKPPAPPQPFVAADLPPLRPEAYRHPSKALQGRPQTQAQF
jgi:hypothetical protein